MASKKQKTLVMGITVCLIIGMIMVASPVYASHGSDGNESAVKQVLIQLVRILLQEKQEKGAGASLRIIDTGSEDDKALAKQVFIQLLHSLLEEEKVKNAGVEEQGQAGNMETDEDVETDTDAEAEADAEVEEGEEQEGEEAEEEESDTEDTESEEDETEEEQEDGAEDMEIGSGTGGAPSSGPESEPEVDSTSPAVIANLTASNPTISSINLNWTAPGDDEGSGTASSYEIRYSTALITNANWNSATQVSHELVPLVAGSSQSITISGLSYSTIYYFAIKTSDEVPNESGLSNVVSLTTNEAEQCSRPIASGERTYTTSTRSVPRITEITVNPLDVNLGETQIVTVKANDSNESPITLVSGSGGTDNDSIPFSLTLIDGDELDGTWQGSWSPQDTFCNNYTVGITATSASGESNVTLTFR